MEDNRLAEADDLFMCLTVDITDSGLGEAARRAKAMEAVQTFSVPGGAVSFAHSPLIINHGRVEAPLGTVSVDNVWLLCRLRQTASNELKICSWPNLIAVARQRYRNLLLPDAIFQNKMLAREPFSDVIADHALLLLQHLDNYMAGRRPNGEHDPESLKVFRERCEGDNALFSPESTTNIERFRSSLTFPKSDSDGNVLAHWHGKIRHRYFRLHFEFPVPKDSSVLRVVYLGPKLTKN